MEPMMALGLVNGTMNAVGQAGQLGLGIFDAWQSHQAFKEAKKQFRKQLDFAQQNANNQVITTNNKIDSATNISSALMNKTGAEGVARLNNAQANNHVQKINVK